MPDKKQIETLTNKFKECAPLLSAIGDQTRQHLILEMMKMGDCKGARVGEITAKTSLSRPAVSHHLSILKSAGIIKVRKEGTKNYYYFDPDAESFDKLIGTFMLAKTIASSLPDRSKESS